MKCLICKNGETSQGYITSTFERDNATIIIKNIPADICKNCGEEYLSDSIAIDLMKQAESAISQGAQVEIRTYKKSS